MFKKSKVTKSTGMLLLGAWLILSGLLQLVNIAIPAVGTIMPLLALLAGVLIILGK